MVFAALSVPPLLLGLVLALAQYEERLLIRPHAPRHAAGKRHVRAVPDPPDGIRRLPAHRRSRTRDGGEREKRAA
ncbi:hypothetical protein [Streptomyces griseocarneus]|uniref:hypothetical protein n=1 Tax=Streptomyces griseocarneus TaxID=51201 RepID=UPI0019BC6253|nr:hypothetical protein [Streptomyces griseocarneus]MBZ6477173.1 hypothetical protein [Streptomyces griseocarneus]GHG53911.1 hypothetical protein GCM10018779_16340 [Streptomyces griseocarneus]